MKTKHFALPLLILTFLSGNAFAQVDETTNDGTVKSSLLPSASLSHWSIGIWGGPDKNHHVIDMSYAEGMEYSDLSGYALGFSGEYHLSGWFSLRGELALLQKNYRLDRNNRFIPFAYTEATNNYLNVPLEAIISLGRTFRLCGFAGVYGGYWLSGNRKGQSLSVSYLVSGDEADTFFDEAYSFNDKRDRRFDAGLSFGIGMRCAIVKRLDLNAELHWYYGLTDIQKDYMSQINPRYNTTRVLRFGIAYWL